MPVPARVRRRRPAGALRACEKDHRRCGLETEGTEIFTREEGGYHHCQVDNVSIGTAYMWDWVRTYCDRTIDDLVEKPNRWIALRSIHPTLKIVVVALQAGLDPIGDKIPFGKLPPERKHR